MALRCFGAKYSLSVVARTTIRPAGRSQALITDGVPSQSRLMESVSSRRAAKVGCVHQSFLFFGLGASY